MDFIIYGDSKLYIVLFLCWFGFYLIVFEEILWWKGYVLVGECWKIYGSDCGVGVEVSIFELWVYEGVDLVVFYSFYYCYYLCKLLGFVCGLGFV